MKTLVIQRARFGDLLQTIPLVRSLETNGEDVSLLVSKDMMEISRLAFPGKEVMGFPGKGEILERGKASLVSPAAALRETMKDLLRQSFDRIIQTNHDGTGVLLGHILKAPEKSGFLSLHEGTVEGCEEESLSGWPAYLVSSARGIRAMNRIHLSDVWTGCGLPWNRRPQAPLRKSPPPSPGAVGIVLSGRSAYRELAMEDVASLAQRIQGTTGRRIVLLGRMEEREKARDLLRLVSGDVENLVGKTSLPELWNVVGSTLSLLISPDTGTLHLAAALGIPTLGLFFANAQPHETGAYASEAICLTPDMDCYPCVGEGSGCVKMECRSRMDIGYVGDLARSMIEGTPLPPEQKGLSVWKSSFEGGILSLRRIHPREATREDILAVLYRRFFLRILEPGYPLVPLEEEFRAHAGRGWPENLSGKNLVRGTFLLSRLLEGSRERFRLSVEFPFLWPVLFHTEEVERGRGNRETQRRAMDALSCEAEKSMGLLHRKPFWGKKRSEVSSVPDQGGLRKNILAKGG
uniref:Heptosyltransferase family protein n=1 Tax=Leptospirillum ferriphilum TaxID=178606 RepID=A0A7C3R0W4_9BACT